MQFWYLLISLVVILLDQGLKYFVVSNLQLGQTKEIISGIISLTYIQNNGAAWNILSGQMIFFYLISIVAVIVCLYFLFNKKYTNSIFDVGLALVLGGVIGNFIDRLHLKYVIDMIQFDFIHFNIFNIADSAITIGIILIFIYLLFFDETGNKNEKEIQS